ncbi:hypothetical protein [Motiliproteus sediminis]|uniref:hypothetical protein n=1 Tax=Motiliproteus sediminis TaxID=1468178 RepID=UPI001AEF3E4C|nr:hypothetical protein [Motiliproteus sediminis]
MSLERFILSTTIIILSITQAACSIQDEYIQPHLEMDLIRQEIAEKQNQREQILDYIESSDQMAHRKNDDNAINANDELVLKNNNINNVEDAKEVLRSLEVQIKKLKSKYRSLAPVEINRDVKDKNLI